MTLRDRFRGFAARITLLGSHWAFLAAVAIIMVWLISGPIFRFSDAWQLVINTGTTVVTFCTAFSHPVDAEPGRKGDPFEAG